MQRFIFKISLMVSQQLPLYNMMRSSHDFEDVKLALNEHINWSIELFRSCFPIHLTSGSSSFMLCTLSFLVMAETIQVRYCRLSPAELKERVEGMGYATFAILIAILDVGFVIVRIAGFVEMSGSPELAASLVLASMLPSVILSLFSYTAKLAERRGRAPDAEEV